MRHRVNEGCRVLGALKGVMKNRGLGMTVNPITPELLQPLCVFPAQVDAATAKFFFFFFFENAIARSWFKISSSI